MSQGRDVESGVWSILVEGYCGSDSPKSLTKQCGWIEKNSRSELGHPTLIGKEEEKESREEIQEFQGGHGLGWGRRKCSVLENK